MASKDDLQKTLDGINSRFGEGSIMKLSEKPKFEGAVISTGCMSLNRAIGVGGIPRGRTTEILGLESSGKTTLMQHIVAEAQKMDLTAAYIDMEHALDESYAARCGVDMEKLLVSQPDTGEEAMEIAEALGRSGAVGLIVVDSVAKLAPKSEVEGTMDSAEMGARSRLMGHALRKLTPVISGNRVALVFTNQIRYKIGVMYGSPETTPAGLALPFEASVRIKLRRVNADTDEVKARVHAKVIKNKVAPPFKECEFDINYDTGIDKFNDMVYIAIADKIIVQKGAWYYFGEEQKWQGKDALCTALEQDSKLRDEIASNLK